VGRVGRKESSVGRVGRKAGGEAWWGVVADGPKGISSGRRTRVRESVKYLRGGTQKAQRHEAHALPSRCEHQGDS
jgi:hypothetical protein